MADTTAELDDDVRLVFEGPRPQRRATVAFRFVLAIPLFIWSYLLSIPLTFAILGIWIAALFTARVPMSLADFEARVIQFQARSYAYSFFLLTDRWPTFELGPIGYPVELDVKEPPRMNRAAILFRYFLMIPAMIVIGLVSSGLAPIVFVLWVITLVSGRMPDSGYGALVSVLRYQMRFSAYAGMLTSEYPRGIFGDEEPAPAPFDAVPEPLPDSPRLSRLVLSKASKRIIVLAMVLSILSFAGAVVAGAIASNSSSAAQLRDGYEELSVASTQFGIDAQACAASTDLGCIREADGRLILALEDFHDTLGEIDFPAGAVALASQLDQDTTRMIALLRQLQETGDAETYRQLATELSQVGTALDQDYSLLYQRILFD